MSIIKSAPLSFIRFELPADNNYSLDIPFILPAFNLHEIDFQFIVDRDREIDLPIKLGIIDPDGIPVLFTAPEILADILSYRYKIAGLPSEFFVESVTLGATFKQYLAVFTKAAFYEKLNEDFGFEIVDDNFVSETLFDPISLAIFETNQTTPIVTEIFTYWYQGRASVSGLPLPPAGSCFSYALMHHDGFGVPEVLGESNKFLVVEEDEFTSLVTYSCAESAFGFVYGATIVNKIRLPFYLLSPQFPSKREAYRKSDGSTKVLSAVLEKEYELTTEQMPEVFHEAMAAMLLHDTIIIENRNIRELTVEVVGVENYSPQWADEEEQLQFAKAKSKVRVAKFGYTNSNC